MRPRRWSTMAIVDGKSDLLEMIRSFPKLMMLFLLSLEFAPGTLASASDSMLDTEHTVYSRSWKDRTKDLRNYEIIVPERVDKDGSPYSVDRHYLRRRRSLTEDEQPGSEGLIYSFKAFGNLINIHLLPDTNFFLSDLMVQHMSENETWLGQEDSGHCFHSGYVEGVANSLAVLSTCESLVGVIQSHDKNYFIEPHLLDVDDTSPQDGRNLTGLTHIIYQWNDSSSGKLDFEDNLFKHVKRKSQGSSSSEELPIPESLHPVLNRSNLTISESHHRQKRSHSKERNVEVMVVADHKMREFHGSKLEHYILTLMAIVNSVYKDKSIGNAINIVVIKIVVLEKSMSDKMISENAASTLLGFCEWQNQVNTPDDSDPRHHDTAVLLTKHDICRSQQKCDTLGLAELGTMCNPRRSCSIIEDNGLSAAFTIAHELGHVFSLRHDDDDECKNKSGSYHLMAPTLDHETKPWSWSTCSRNKITDFLDSGNGECLNDSPVSIKPFPVLADFNGGFQKLPGSVYNADDQCAHIFEPDSKRCPYMPVCKRLWCTNQDYERTGCKTVHMPWADGTPCSQSPDDWCYRGQCVKMRIMPPRDGKWGQWQPYGSCSRTCGGGIQKSIRLCNDPEPENGGKYCMGRRVKYKSCNHKECPEGSIGFRELQCRKYNGKHFNINGLTPSVTWTAKYSGIESKDRCKLFCMVTSSTAYYQLADRVEDGTKCAPDTSDVCVMGQCKRAGCDNHLGSLMKRDSCGVCGGDNSNCRQISDNFSADAKVHYGYNPVVKIPKGATNIDIRQFSPNENSLDDTYLALADADHKYLLNGNFIVSSFPKEILLADGSLLQYNGSNQPVERINATAAIMSDIHVYVLTVGDLRHHPNIQWQYTIKSMSRTDLPRRELRSNNGVREEPEFEWSRNTLDWTECSRLCHGEKVRPVVCIQKSRKALVSDHNCIDSKTPKPPEMRKLCHTGCKLSWKVVSQNECSAKCGENGHIRQEIRCQKDTRSDRSSTFVNDEHCQHLDDRPPDNIDCVGACRRARWVYTSWSECNRPCGGGEQFRNAQCISYGRNVSAEYCRDERKLIGQKCNTESCPQWVAGDWTGCSMTCGNGWRYRTVECRQDQKSVIKTRCSPGDQPSSQVECNLGSCPVWDAGKWSQCSSTCGDAERLRIVKCRSANGDVIEDSKCDAAMQPRTMAKCPYTTCATPSIFPLSFYQTTPSYADSWLVTPETLWRTGSWTECSATCGKGSRQRYVSCRDLEGRISPDSSCSHLVKPDYVEECMDRTCGQWRTGDWTHCSATCGQGRETRYVACVSLEELEEQVVSTSQCDVSVKPPIDRICNTRDCIAVEKFDILVIDSNRPVGLIHWKAGPWSPCSSTCETGFQMRRVVCRDEKGDSNLCDPNTQPPDRQACNMGHCPYWNHGEWSQCDVTCDGGTQRRMVHCQLSTGVILPDANCLDFPPTRTQPCALAPCPDSILPGGSGHWNKEPWSSCSVTCGKGHKTRNVSCLDDASGKVVDGMCTGEKPKSITWCRPGRCPYWSPTSWGECSVSCGGGVRQRGVQCLNGTGGGGISERFCQHLQRPNVTEACHQLTCQPYNWISGNWTGCSQSCGFGIKERKVSCVKLSTGSIVDDKLCNSTLKPKPKLECSLQPCPFIWITSDWTRCSMSCGVGIQKRTISCRGVASEGWLLPGQRSYSACNQSERPVSERYCSYGSCDSSYRWEVSNWSLCSRTCGFGRLHRKVSCVDTSGSRHSLENCNALYAPDKTRPCYMGPCYSSSCSEMKQNTPARNDGEYTLLVHGQLIQIYCRDLARSFPKEYLTISADENENYSEVYDKRLVRLNTCPANGSRIDKCPTCFKSTPHSPSGRTKFSKLRLNITSLQVITDDFTFSNTNGLKPTPYATAGDCYSRSGNCPQGRFSVSLSGTRFRVSPEVGWSSVGFKTAQEISISSEGQVVHGRCGGHCGRCSTNTRGLLQLQLIS